MAVHFGDLSDPRKRKHVYENVASDLIDERFAVNFLLVQNKWNSLIRSYNKSKDTKTRTG